MTPAGVARLKADEGCVLSLYTDSVGVPTIGYGRNLQANGIRQSEADIMFANDVADCEAMLTQECVWYRALDPVRQDVVTNLAFNLGVHGLLTFRRMIAALAAKDYALAASELLDSAAARELPNRYGRLASALRSGVL